MDTTIDAIIDVMIEEKVPIALTGAGTPKPYLPKLKTHGIKVVSVIPNVMIAKKMEALGVDAIVAEGMEAGGHIGAIASLPLIYQVAQAVSIPVICAGGIASGHGIVAARALGAEGVQIGTRFLASKECPIPDAFKERVLAATDTSTVITGARSGHPVRCLANDMTEKYIQIEYSTNDQTELDKLTIGSLRKAVLDGDVENGSLMCGQIAGAVREIKPVKTIIEELMAEVTQILNHLSVR